MSSVSSKRQHMEEDQTGQVTPLQYFLWTHKPELQHGFDLDTCHGRRQYQLWYQTHMRSAAVALEQGLPAMSRQKLEGWLGKLNRRLPNTVRRFNKRGWQFAATRYTVWKYRLEHVRLTLVRQGLTGRSRQAASIIRSPEHGNHSATTTQGQLAQGVNLIGHVKSENGLGEHVRLTARAMSLTDIAYGLFDFAVGIPARQQANYDPALLLHCPRYSINLMHLNADRIPDLLFYAGETLFTDHYNIIYPFWELARWPDAWRPALALFDEIWAPTRYIQQAIAAVTAAPVKYMPMAIAKPEILPLTRSELGLETDSTVFLSVFDAYSYVQRKNPLAAIEGFLQAFPDGHEKVQLVIKTMNARMDDRLWLKVIRLAKTDRRIRVINQTMTRREVSTLLHLADVFVSLHRAEGYGLLMAEAMCLGKPVIATGYSGNMDFMTPETACLVNYRLIPVDDGEYLFATGQLWADPDIEQAADYMKVLHANPEQARRIGEQAAEYIYGLFSPSVLAPMYKQRLEQIMERVSV